jgi:hypothetical protein
VPRGEPCTFLKIAEVKRRGRSVLHVLGRPAPSRSEAVRFRAAPSARWTVRPAETPKEGVLPQVEGRPGSAKAGADAKRAASQLDVLVIQGKSRRGRHCR